DHACGGVCACSTCHVIVREGLESCNEATDDELDMVEEARGVTTESRLGCQCVPNGTCEVIVEIPMWNRNLVSEDDHGGETVVSDSQPRLPRFSFPGSAWERTDARLCLAEATHARPRQQAAGGDRASKTLRSQAEPGNEKFLTRSVRSTINQRGMRERMT